MSVSDGSQILYIHPDDLTLISKYGYNCFEPNVNAELFRQCGFLGMLHERYKAQNTRLFCHETVKRGTAVTLRPSKGNANDPESLVALPMLLEPLANRTVHELYTLDDDEPLTAPRTAWERILDED